MGGRRRHVAAAVGAAAVAGSVVTVALVGTGRSGWASEERLRRLEELQEIVVRYTVDAITLHKTLYPLDVSDVLGLGAAMLGLMIAAGGGIGGGGMLVPIYVLVMGFRPRFTRPKFAIPLSNTTVLGGAITNVALNAWKRHPAADRSLVDWDLLILMEPLTLAGALAGGLVNKLAPETLIVVLLVVTLAITSDKTLRKGLKLYDKESEAMAKSGGSVELSALGQAEKAAAAAEEAASLLGGEEGRDEAAAKKEAPPLGKKKESLSPEDAALLEAIYAEERQTFPAWKVGILAFMTALIIAMNLVKGGGSFPSPIGIECGTTQYWLATLAMFVALIAIALYVRDYLMTRTADKDRLGYVYAEGDFHWDETSTIKYPCICFFAGMCAGLFGIGGGIVNGPLMLELGVLPAVAGATTAPMILLTSSAAATTFYTFGLTQLDYASRLFVVGLGATVVGQFGMTYLIKKSGRQSYVAFSIGAVVSISTVLMGAHGLLSLAYPADEGAPKGFCDSGE